MDGYSVKTGLDLLPLSQAIWEDKYQFKALDKTPIDLTPADTYRRVARALASTETDPDYWEKQFFWALEGNKFIPAGRILSGAGTDRKVTLFNCFVMGDIPDDMTGIFEHLKEAALTMQQGGGIGYDFSTLRPKGAPVKGVGADASGPLSFMDVWDSMCRTIMSAGSRRGAMMGVMRCDHPDIEAFVAAKKEKGRLRMFNLSVLITDPFMEAVKNDGPWTLTFGGVDYKTMPARELWDQIMTATYAYAEPGVIFIDRINRLNNLHYCETIHGTNPCVTADTQVRTNKGWQRIDSLTEPSTIMGSDGKWHDIGPAFITGIKPVFELTTRQGHKLKLTADHQVLTTRGDVPAAELIIDEDEVLVRGFVTGKEDEVDSDVVVSLEPAGEETVWDLTEPVTHHFVANGIVIHNCGEQPLPPYGVCLLGSVNLAVLIKNPFEEDSRIDEENLRQVVRTATRMLDDVIDVSGYPLEQHEQHAKTTRRIGMGVTGLADALMMCGLTYGSKAAVAATNQWLGLIRREAYLASVDLAKEKGPFPAYQPEPYLAGENIQALDDDVKEAIAAHGIRNALLTSIAPTGTISLFSNNVSSGIEPVFSLEYTRTVLNPDRTERQEQVSDYAYRLFRHLKGEDALLPDCFVTAQTLSPAAHLAMQATVQKYIDAAISKTLNLPEDISVDDFKEVYMQAYDMGCKGCTTYRPNDVTGAVLSTNSSKEAAPAAKDDQSLGIDIIRPEELPGSTYKLDYPEEGSAMYITINDVIDGGRRRPFEMFINSRKMDHFAWTVALTRMISAIFRRGGDISFVVEELKAVFDPRGGHWMGGRYIPSLLAAIGDTLMLHLDQIGYLSASSEPLTALAPPAVHDCSSHSAAPKILGRTCGSCGQPSVYDLGGCPTCTSCGASKCA